MGPGLSAEIKTALVHLSRAIAYANDTGSSHWDFAVSICHLRSLGVTEIDLRWLVKKGLVEHAYEVTVLGEDGREFRATGDLTFGDRTCFILTDLGWASAQSLSPLAVSHVHHSAEFSGPSNETLETFDCVGIVPCWDAYTRKLVLGESVVKQFRWPAVNQEAVLNAFQEEGWPRKILDPLPPQPEQDSKRRLADTIKCLNKKQTNRLIEFHGDGTGEGVFWEITA
ncbi:MAG: hypothetical protein AAFU85_33280 [Planctomycetota bacterium]